MTADDVDAWDSLTHIDLIVAVEKAFRIKLSTSSVRGLKNVGDFIALITSKLEAG
jgi:acyl carrier protein